MPDAAGNFKGMAVNAEAWERIFARAVDADHHAHDPETCAYCEDNWYDDSVCPGCAGEGCDDCEQHGFVGYSW